MCNEVGFRVQCSAERYSAVQSRTVQCRAVQCSAEPYSAVRCSAVQCGAVRYHALPFCTARYGMCYNMTRLIAVRYDAVRHIVVWCDAAEYNTVRYGMLPSEYGTVQYSTAVK